MTADWTRWTFIALLICVLNLNLIDCHAAHDRPLVQSYPFIRESKESLHGYPDPEPSESEPIKNRQISQHSESLGLGLPFRPKRGSIITSPKKCQCNCSLNSPVCGRGPKGTLEDFPSECAMECYACTNNKRYTLFRRGACPTTTPVKPTLKPFTTPTPRGTTRRPSPTPQCQCNCPKIHPICARNKHGVQETFPSECALQCFNCTHNSDYRKIKDGDCEKRSGMMSKLKKRSTKV
uniref:Kazal-like domain-containing protein n=1 Tax=Cacopsylla melanoneura TaxID=428564 RepID=A0A8D8X1M8_9HEMI